MGAAHSRTPRYASIFGTHSAPPQKHTNAHVNKPNSAMCSMPSVLTRTQNPLHFITNNGWWGGVRVCFAIPNVVNIQSAALHSSNGGRNSGGAADARRPLLVDECVRHQRRTGATERGDVADGGVGVLHICSALGGHPCEWRVWSARLIWRALLMEHTLGPQLTQRRARERAQYLRAGSLRPNAVTIGSQPHALCNRHGQ